jgi:hypothetical protein
MSFIVSQTRQIMSRAIERYAKERGAQPEAMQLLMKMKDDGVGYFLMRDYRLEKELTIMDILGVRVDFKGYSLIAPQFIRQSLERMVGQYNVSAGDLSVIVTRRQEIKMYAYNQKNVIGEVTFAYLFGEDAVK